MEPSFTYVEGDHVYRLDAWPVWLSVAGASLCLIAVGARAALRGTERNDASYVTIAWTVGPLAFLGAMAFGGVVLVNTVLGHLLWPPPRTAWQIFQAPYIAALASGICAGILAFVYALLALKRWRLRSVVARRVTSVLSTTAIVAGAALAQTGPALTTWLAERRGMPRIVETTTWIHQGERVTLQPKLERGASPGWTTPAPITLDARRVGITRVQSSVTSGGLLHVERRWTVRTRDASADPGLPLRVGNRWQYRWVRTSSGALLWGMVRTAERSTEGRFELTVRDTRLVRGVRRFEIARFDGSNRPRAYWVYPLEGRTYLMAGDEPRPTDTPLDLPPPGSDASFTLPMIDATCHGIATNAMAGACACERRDGPDVGAVVLTVLTLGLASPSTSERTVLMLESAQPGNGVAARLAAPRPGRLPEVTPPSCDLPSNPRAWFCVVGDVAEDAVPADVARRITRAGLTASELPGRRVVMRARRDQVGRILGARLRGRATPTSPCPGFRCQPEIIRDRTAPATEGLRTLRLDLRACESAP